MPSIKSSVGNSKHISLDDVCFLISQESYYDELGQDSFEETTYQCFCSKLSITRQEFLNAGQLGYKPQLVIVVNSDEYDEQKVIEYEEKRYTVYKTFQRADGYKIGRASCRERV